MNEALVAEIAAAMAGWLDCSQMKQLKTVLKTKLDTSSGTCTNADNESLLISFLKAKSLEGCSPRTIEYYESTLRKLSATITKSGNTYPTTNGSTLPAKSP